MSILSDIIITQLQFMNKMSYLSQVQSTVIECITDKALINPSFFTHNQKIGDRKFFNEIRCHWRKLFQTKTRFCRHLSYCELSSDRSIKYTSSRNIPWKYTVVTHNKTITITWCYRNGQTKLLRNYAKCL